MGKFKKGFVLGGLLGAGMAWMSLTPKGKEVKEKLLDQSAEVYEEVKKTVMASDEWKKMNKQKYVAMVREVVNKYAVENGLAEKTRDMIVKLVSSQWKNIQKEINKQK